MKVVESTMYPDVVRWLVGRLNVLRSGWKAEAFDTSKMKLNSFLERRGLSEAFDDYAGFEIEVDVTGVLRRGKKVELAFVECKSGPITLKDVGQILGYSRVANPTLALIVSPMGLSAGLNLLLHTYNRVDLLEFGSSNVICAATWDLARKQIQPSSIYPPGVL